MECNMNFTTTLLFHVYKFSHLSWYDAVHTTSTSPCTYSRRRHAESERDNKLFLTLVACVRFQFVMSIHPCPAWERRQWYTLASAADQARRIFIRNGQKSQFRETVILYVHVYVYFPLVTTLNWTQNGETAPHERLVRGYSCTPPAHAVRVLPSMRASANHS